MNALAQPLGRDLQVAPQTATLLAHCVAAKLSREELAHLPTPIGTDTHRPVPHYELVNVLDETLSFRHISIVRSEFAVTPDGMKLFGVLELEQGFEGCRFAIGVRNSHDKSMRLAMTVGYRVFVCDNLAFHGDFTPVLAKHSKKFNITAALSVGVDQMARAFGPMVQAVTSWREHQLSDEAAKLLIYRAFLERELDIPRSLGPRVHDLYFNPTQEAFAPRTLWSLSNAFTAALKDLDPIPQFKATARLGAFLNQ